MRLNIVFALFFSLPIFIIGCIGDDVSEDTVNNIEVQFLAKYDYGEQPLVMFKKYLYPNGDSILFNRISFYLSDLIIKGSESDTLIPVEYLNFTNQNITESMAAEGLTFNFDTKLQNLEELSFGVGVNAANNAKDPVEYTGDNPLSRVAEHWPGWSSFVFAKIEGQYFSKNGGPTLNFALHTGSDDAYFIKKVSPSTMALSDDTKVTIAVHLKQVFEGDKIYDMEKNPGLHSLSQKDQVLEISNNLSNAIDISIK